MAKLSAYGRIEVSTFTKTDGNRVSPDTDITYRRTKLRLMSDGQILIKVDCKFSDGSPMSFPWKKWAKIKDWDISNPERTEAFKNIALKKGFTEEL
jgi:hypothetical protein